MKKWLLILSALISFSIFACDGRPDKTDSSSASAKTGGGSLHIDSQKTIGTGVNGQSSNDLNTADTAKTGHSVVLPADSLNKKKR